MDGAALTGPEGKRLTEAQRLTIRASEIRQRLNEVAGLEGDALTDEIRSESDALTTEYRDVETRLRAAIVAEGEPETTGPTAQDAEHRERIELRGRASLGGYLLAAMQGRLPGGELAEYSAACGGGDGLPLDLFESDRPVEMRADGTTPAPGTVGVNLAAIQPYVFAQSIAGRLGIAMPSVGSGSHVETTITAALTAGAVTKGGARESTAATLTPITATPRRISARLSIAMEDVAQIGVGNFEAALRENLSMALADAYDEQAINGNGTAPAVSGLLHQLTRPDAPTDVATFDSFVETVTGFVDGKWAMTAADVMTITNPETYRLSASMFQVVASAGKGELAASSYLSRESGGWSTAARMPATPTSGGHAKIADAIVYLKGRSGLRTAVHPVWSTMQIDDIYTDSASGVRHVTLHALVGDKLLLVQPAAYSRASFKVKA